MFFVKSNFAVNSCYIHITYGVNSKKTKE